jgi:hypothetical protein
VSEPTLTDPTGSDPFSSGADAEPDGAEQSRESETSEPLHPQPATPAPENGERKGMSETLTRVLTALVLVPAVLYAIHGKPYRPCPNCDQ